jgi:S-DNA-T family DNA segregation ATPase FtsK/SpoIIIE
VRLKFTLESAGLRSSALQPSGGDSRDLVATIDSSTTVGALATYLARADPERSAWAGLGEGNADADSDSETEGEFTLALVDQFHRALDARSTVPESGLHSGVTVAVTRHSESVVDVGPPVAVAAVVAGPDSGKEFPLWRGTAYIGRGHGAEIQVSDSSVSRRHARLLVAGLPDFPGIAVPESVEVMDLGSANGISVGGAEVARAVLKAGDRVRLGDTEIEVRLLGTPCRRGRLRHD